MIAERIGWTRSIRVLSARVAELRPVYSPPDRASRTAYAGGEIAQCDSCFPDVAVPVDGGQMRTAGAVAGVDHGVGLSGRPGDQPGQPATGESGRGQTLRSPAGLKHLARRVS